MDLRRPVQSLTWALIRATERDLDGVVSEVATDLLKTQSGQPVATRPRESDCGIVMFSQCWSGSALGYGKEAGTPVQAETIVVTGPCGDACVYVSTQLLYHVRCPNRRFFLDVAAQQMKGKDEAAQYEGRDSSDEEAFDYEVAGVLARVRGAVQHLAPKDAERVVRRLRACAEELAQLGQTAAASR